MPKKDIDTTAAPDGRIPPSSRRLERDRHGQPIYSNTPGGPRHETNPAFSDRIAPGPNERRYRRGGGPIYS
jgi:hypothetical protein